LQNISVEEIKDYLEITPGMYTGGQPTRDQIKMLGELGFTILINLATSASPDSLPDEQELAQAAGMAYVQIPVEWQAPTKGDLLKFFQMFEQHKGFKTFVHCAKNMRVSIFIYLYRVIVENEDRQLCWEDVLSIWEPNEIWQQFIDQMLVEIQPPKNDRNWQFDWRGYSGL
jgi:protein tyrosine phosphatase (PTP) superfamily phosphohydrolase (DUF442 family)